MYKVDAAGHVANEFSNAGSSTRVDADFMNEVMYELVNVVLAGSLTLAKGTRTQVRDAIAVMIAAAGGVPDATTTTKGKLEIATDAEAITGTSTSLAIVCSNLTARLALYAKLSVANVFEGQVSAPSFNTTSSRRWKKKIRKIDPAKFAEALDSVNLVTYRSRQTGELHAGLIAEELVKQGLGWLVRFDKKGKPESVDYNSYFILRLAEMHAAIKSYDSRLSTLEAKVEALTNA